MRVTLPQWYRGLAGCVLHLPKKVSLRSLATSHPGGLVLWHRHQPGLWEANLAFHTETAKSPPATGTQLSKLLELLPWSCPGCGAYTQLLEPEEAGYFSSTRKPVKAYIAARTSQIPWKKPESLIELEDKPQEEPPLSLDASLESTRSENGVEGLGPSQSLSTPVCDRCHNLVHHHKGASVANPTISSLQAIFEETPHRNNHVYHVIDAADFPLSLIPRLHDWLDLSPQRSLNRRAKHAQYRQGRVAEMSFIITRSDLLAPKKEQVDNLMPTILRILRRALGRSGKEVRLGNVRLVSSHRGWWTRDVKEALWERGGGGWMVGKANVGKSKLFESILPKGRVKNSDLVDMGAAFEARDHAAGNQESHLELAAEEASLLPPRPREVPYPVLPVVSELPGTTASPIRVPFGRGKGELIDLPGLSRGGLDDLILDEHKPALVMKDRVKAKQVVIRPWQSLLISNIICLTPTTPDVTVLAAPFLPHGVEYHVCDTEKAKEILAQTRNHVLTGIAKPEVPATIRSAGKCQIKWDITLQRAGPLTAKDAVGLSPSRLPFAVFGLDIVLEGIGWIELSAQVRRRALEHAPVDPATGESLGYPEVEVFSPNGEHVGHRETLNVWLLGGARRPPRGQRKARPRKGMKGAKKAAKRERRAELARRREAATV